MDLTSHDNQLGILKAKLEKALEENALSLEAQRLSGMGVWKYDILNNIIKWSEEVYRIYEMDPAIDQPRLDDIFYYANPKEKESVEKIINDAIRTGASYNLDCTIITKSKKIKYVNALGRPFLNVKGELLHLFGTVTDITETKKLVKALQFSDFTIESISDGVFWLDEKGRFIKVNRAACKALGYTKEELYQLQGADVNPTFTIEKSRKLWEETKKTGVLTFETSHRRKDGTLFPVEITNNIIEYEGRELRCSIVRNITQRKLIEGKITKALEEVESLKNQLEKENIYLQQEINLEQNFGDIATNSQAFKKVLRKAEQVAKTDASVLLLGESGTGKELLAHAIHHFSNREKRPLIKVNCAALPANLIESELFGHEKGAFTGAMARKAGRFELANNGTIFLDEIGELPVELQSKLLRVLQEGEFERLGGSSTMKVDVRVIAATNRNLEQAIKEGLFREDLFYRLNVFPIETIPLRERKEDIPMLVHYFVNKHSTKQGKSIEKIPVKVMEALQEYNWPGNIRELTNLVERAVIISKGKLLAGGDWLPTQNNNNMLKNSRTLEEVEREHIIQTLKSTNWRVSGKSGAAIILGMNAKTLDSRMRKLDIKRS